MSLSQIDEFAAELTAPARKTQNSLPRPTRYA